MFDKFFRDLPDENRLPIKSRLRQDKWICEILKEIQKRSENFYGMLKAGILLPQWVYLFDSTLEPRNGDEDFYYALGFFRI